jgi:hypothetical protein
MLTRASLTVAKVQVIQLDKIDIMIQQMFVMEKHEEGLCEIAKPLALEKTSCG